MFDRALPENIVQENLEVEAAVFAVNNCEDLGSEGCVRDATLFVASTPYWVEVTEGYVSGDYLESGERVRLTVYLIAGFM